MCDATIERGDLISNADGDWMHEQCVPYAVDKGYRMSGEVLPPRRFKPKRRRGE